MFRQSLALALLSVAWIATSAVADTSAVTNFAGGSVAVGGGALTSRTDHNMKITALGVWDKDGDGLAADEGVTVYQGVSIPFSTVLGSGTVPSGTQAPLVNGFRFITLNHPILLPAGTETHLLSGSGDPVTSNPSSVTAAPGITVTASGGAFPQNAIGPSFQFTTAPLVNADFENGPFMTMGTVTGWTVTGNVADIDEGATGGLRGAALSAGSDSEGDVLSQPFFTTPNQRYDVDFDSGIFGQRDGGPLQVNVQVIGDGTLTNDTVTPPDAFTFDPSQVTFQHYHYSFVANSWQTTLQFTDIGLGNLNADAVVDSVSATATPAAYSTWQTQYFTDSQQNDLSISGWDADPDHDGIPNGLEYYFNFNPVTGITPAEAAAMPHITSQSPFNNTVTYRRRIGAGGKLLYSSDLQTWSDTSNLMLQMTTTPTGDGVTEDVTVTWPNDTRRFFRVSLSLEHPASATQWSSSVGGNNHWYEVVQSPTLTWQQARDYAVDRGGYLATMTSAAENSFVTTLIPSGVQPYIGGYKENNVFRWVTAEAFSFTNWTAGEPNNFGGVEDRINMVHGDGTWNDTKSSDLNAFVVEYPQ